MAAITGLSPWDWSSRELTYAANEKLKVEFSKFGIGAARICNTIPSLSSQPRAPVQLWDINPFLKAPPKRKTPPELIAVKLSAWARRNASR